MMASFLGRFLNLYHITSTLHRIDFQSISSTQNWYYRGKCVFKTPPSSTAARLCRPAKIFPIFRRFSELIPAIFARKGNINSHCCGGDFFQYFPEMNSASENSQKKSANNKETNIDFQKSFLMKNPLLDIQFYIVRVNQIEYTVWALASFSLKSLNKKPIKTHTNMEAILQTWRIDSSGRFSSEVSLWGPLRGGALLSDSYCRRKTQRNDRNKEASMEIRMRFSRCKDGRRRLFRVGARPRMAVCMLLFGIRVVLCFVVVWRLLWVRCMV